MLIFTINFIFFTLRTHLHSHVNLHELKCQMCSKKFHRIQNLLNHLEHHISTKQLVCALCSDSFSSKDLLQNHIDEEHKKPQGEIKTSRTTCGVFVPEEKLDEHAKTHKNYPCPYCRKSFSLKAALRLVEYYLLNFQKIFWLKIITCLLIINYKYYL